MALTVADFLISFPEFYDAPATLVSAKLADAVTMCDPAAWGAEPARDLTQQGVFLYTASFLAESPYGRKMALVDDRGRSIYQQRLDVLKRIVGIGFRVC